MIPTREKNPSNHVSPAVLWANRSLAFRALTRSFFSLSSSYWHNMNLSILEDDEGGLHVTLSRDTMALAFSLTFSPWSLFSSTNWKSFKVWIAKMFSLHCWATYKHQKIFQSWMWHKTCLKTECGIRLFQPSRCRSLWDTPTAPRPCIHGANSCHGRLVFSKSFALSQRMPPEKEKWEISQHVIKL